MRITLKVGIISAFAWILVKLSIFGMGISIEKSINPSILINMLFVVLAISIGLYLQKRSDTDEGNALNDMKNGMSAGIPYAIIVSIFLYFYYAKINPEFTQHKISEGHTELLKKMKDPIKYKQLKNSNPDYEISTDKQIIKNEMNSLKSIWNAKSVSVLTLLALTMYSTFNSIIITIIYRKIVFKRK